MAGFSLDDDTLTALVFAFAAFFALVRTVQRYQQKRMALAGMWAFITALCAASAVFLMTFQIRLF